MRYNPDPDFGNARDGSAGTAEVVEEGTLHWNTLGSLDNREEAEAVVVEGTHHKAAVVEGTLHMAVVVLKGTPAGEDTLAEGKAVAGLSGNSFLFPDDKAEKEKRTRLVGV